MLHLIPRESVLNGRKIPIRTDDYLRPIGVHGWNPRPIADGIVGWAPTKDNLGVVAYTTLHEDGRIEAVRGIPVTDRGDKYLVNSAYFEGDIYKSTQNYFEKLEEKGIEPPIYLCLSLLGVEGLAIGIGGWRGSVEPDQKFRTSPLLLDPVEMDSYRVDIEQELADEVRKIWRDAGHWGSMG